MVTDLSKLKGGRPGEAMTACLQWLPRPEFFTPPVDLNNPMLLGQNIVVPVLTVDFLDNLGRKQTVTFPPDMIVPFCASLLGWAAGMMGGSAPQTPESDGLDQQEEARYD